MPIILVDVSRGGFIIIKYSVLRAIGITITNIVTLQVTSAGLHQTFGVAALMPDMIIFQICHNCECLISLQNILAVIANKRKMTDRFLIKFSAHPLKTKQKNC